MTMETSRRGFMGLLAAAPLSAKQAAEHLAANVGTLGPVIPKRAKPLVRVPGSVARLNLKNIDARPPVGVDPVRRVIAGWKRRQIAKRYGKVTALDPDLAAMRSISLTTKVREQRRRQIERAEADVWEEILLDKCHRRAEREQDRIWGPGWDSIQEDTDTTL